MTLMIPYGRQEITEEDIEAVVKVLHSDFLTQGPAVPAFEQKLCDYTGANHVIAVNSCTAALHIACLALGLGPGDILWTSPITFVASANCALYCGASVDFVDIEPDTALMSVEKLKEKLEHAEKEGKLPKIVVPVHFAGQPCDMEEIHALGQKYGFKIIEDAAHAIGSTYKGEPTGSCRYSDITVFSYHPVKIITTGEGGAALTNDLQLAERMELLRSHGITRDSEKMVEESHGPWYYEQIDLGFNYRMTDLQAALGSSQLARMHLYVSRRGEVARWYDDHFESLPVNPLEQKSDRSSVHHLYVIRVEGGEDEKKHIHQQLIEAEIGVNLHYIPVYRQPYYHRSVQGGRGEEMRLKGAEAYYARAVSLPIFSTIQPVQMARVVQAVSQVCGLSVR